jgi:dihydropteroate synthase
MRRLGSRFALLTLATGLALSGCGYSVRPPYDPNIRTVYVPVFRSVTFRRDINLMLTEHVIKEIGRRTPFHVVGTAEGADSTLDGTINFSDKNLIVQNPFNLPRQLSATLVATVTVDRQHHQARGPEEHQSRRGLGNQDVPPGSGRDGAGRVRPDLPGSRHPDRQHDGRAVVSPRWEALGRAIVDGPQPRVMAILNVTPDSFSDGGRAEGLDAALRHAERLVAEGADLLDVGGESSRPGAEPIGVEEELRRVVPVVQALAARFPVPISVDTTKVEVARASLAAGAAIINDIQGLADPELADLVARSGAGVVLMHMAGTPRTMQDNPHYDDVVREVRDDLAAKVARAEAVGIPRARIAVDPGIGFGKTVAHNLALLRDLGKFTNFGCALLIGTSRKGFLGHLTGRPIAERGVASVASALAAAAAGANVVRVHDVGMTVDALRVWEAQHGWPRPGPDCRAGGGRVS